MGLVECYVFVAGSIPSSCGDRDLWQARCRFIHSAGGRSHVDLQAQRYKRSKLRYSQGFYHRAGSETVTSLSPFSTL